jgi:hypothetical protein
VLFRSELLATATDRKVGLFFYIGPAIAAGPGAVGWSLTFYSGVVWNVPTIDSYRSYPNAYYSLGLTLGVGGVFGFSQGWFSTADGSQYGQTTGVTFGTGVKPSGSLDINWSFGPMVIGEGLEAVEPYLVFAWPPGQNVLLNLKAHRLIRW